MAIVKGTFQTKEWFDQVETSEHDWVISWKESASKNGCPAFLKADPKQKAWVKPRRDQPDIAVKEKVGADLSYLLDLPVASVLLCKATTPKGQIRPVALSRYSYSDSHLKWSRVKLKGREKQVIASVNQYFQDNLIQTAGIWVFDTWIRNRDRTDRNIMIGYSKGQLDDVYFYDFDISMSWRGDLNSGNWSKIFVAKTSEHISEKAELKHCMPYIEKIESLPKEDIIRVIDRIPDFYLPKDRKEIYKRALLYRRE
ncbi:MAG: HipA family kinase, partial [Thermoactinomyces sp.]